MMKQSFSTTEKVILAGLFVVLIPAVIASFVNVDFVNSDIVNEDGPLEWLTVVGLVSCAVLAFVRLVRGVRQKRSFTYLAGLCLTVIIFTFGAGEEISWGQRIFGIESPEFFEQNNAQLETNVHNLLVGETKINKLIFGKLLAVFICGYAFVLPWLWSTKPKIRSLAAMFAVPVPNLLYGLIFLGIFLLTDQATTVRRGEYLEFAGSIIFFLMTWRPLNLSDFGIGARIEAESSAAGHDSEPST